MSAMLAKDTMRLVISRSHISGLNAPCISSSAPVAAQEWPTRALLLHSFWAANGEPAASDRLKSLESLGCTRTAIKSPLLSPLPPTFFFLQHLYRGESSPSVCFANCREMIMPVLVPRLP